MVATRQYYQHLYKRTTASSTQGSAGEWISGASEWVYVGLCREETNGKGNAIQTGDGRTIVFGSLIQMPAGTQRISEGTKIIVARDAILASSITDAYIAGGLLTGEVIANGENLKFDGGRLHCRLWI